MKTKKLILAVFVLFACTMHSQYFQKMYSKNVNSNDLAGKGVCAATAAGDNLYYQAGTTTYKNPAGIQLQNPMITATDKNAAIIFCKDYTLPLTTGTITNGSGRQVAVDPLTGNILIIGDFVTAPTVNYGVFVFAVTPAGAVVAGSIKYFYNPLGPTYKIRASAIKVVTSGGTPFMLACGQAESSTPGVYDPWVFRYTMAYAGWFRIYDETINNVHWNTKPNDLIESGFSGVANEIAVVGESINTNDYVGFLMRVDPGTGNMLSYRTYDSGIPTSDDRFMAITKCNDVAMPGSTTGYVIGGYSNVLSGVLTASQRVWGIRTNNTGAVVYWNNIYPYPIVASCFGNGIVEYLNGINYEYFISGTASPGVIGAADDILYKINNLGATPAGFGLTTFGTTTGNNEYGINIGLSNNTTAFPGLTIFSQREVAPGNNDLHLVKCSLNGVLAGPAGSPCRDIKHSLDPRSQAVKTQTFVSVLTNNPPKIVPNPTPFDGIDKIICTTLTPQAARPSGIAENDLSNKLSFTAFPNPVNGGELLKLNLNSIENKTVRIELTNLIGQTILTTEKEISAGESKLEIQLPGGLQGLHALTIIEGANRMSTLISVK